MSSIFKPSTFKAMFEKIALTIFSQVFQLPYTTTTTTLTTIPLQQYLNKLTFLANKKILIVLYFFTLLDIFQAK